MKFYKVKRKVFNLEGKRFDDDVITMHQADYERFVGTKEYQESLRDPSTATPIELTIVQEWPSHEAYLEECKKARAIPAPEVDVNNGKIVYTEKTLNPLNKAKLTEILTVEFKTELTEDLVTKADIINKILFIQESNQ